MPLSEKEAAEIKNQLLKQLEKFPEDKREQIQKQVNAMSVPEVESFVEQNNLTHMGGQCIFCSIVAGQSPSFKIAENKENIAVLEINPLNKGHVLIVPKEHLEKTTESASNLAKEVSELLSKKFSPKNVQIGETNIMGHALLEVIPIYGGEKERRPATNEELKDVQEQMLKKEDVPVIEEPKAEQEIIEEKMYELPPRIP